MISELLDDAARIRIEEIILQTERGTSAEIRVHIEDQCKELALDRAAFIFSKLEMHQTDLRNGVLIYVALLDRKAAILGDAGINAKVKADFWDDTMQEIITHFKNQEIEKGIIAGVRKAGEQLKEFFPIGEGDRNELSNTVTISRRKKNYGR